MSHTSRVESLHINVGDGDCVIHLLIKEVPAKPRAIVKAVLVDAGPANTFIAGSPSLANAIDNLRRDHNWDTPTFDAVVISSWHPGYYGGLFDLVNRDLATSSTVAGAPAGSKLTDFKFSWLKYDENGNPLTTFYLPSEPPRHVPMLKVDTNTKILSYGGFHPEAENPIWIDRLGLAVFNGGDLLGKEIFSGKALSPDVSIQSIKSPALLVELNPPAEGELGLYCISADQKSLGEGSWPPNDEACISLLLAWIDNGQPALQYYGAGKIGPVAQKILTEWISPANQRRSVATVKIGSHDLDVSATIKLVDSLQPRQIIISCGSKYGSPQWQLILLLHTWLMCQSSEIATSRPVYSTQYPFYFIKEADGLCFRYKDFTKTGQISYDDFTNPSSMGESFRAALADLYSRANEKRAASGEPDIVNVYDDFHLWIEENLEVPDQVNEYARDWITDQCEQRWSQLSPITAQSHEAAGAATHGAGSEPVSIGGSIEYICLESWSGSSQNETTQVLVRYLGQNEGVRASPIKAGVNAAAQSPSQQKDNQPRGAVTQFHSASIRRLQSAGKAHTGRQSVLTNKASYQVETIPRLDFKTQQLLLDRDEQPVFSESGSRLPDKKYLAEVKENKLMVSGIGAQRIGNCILSSSAVVRDKSKISFLLPLGEADNFVGSLASCALWLKTEPKDINQGYEIETGDGLLRWFTTSVQALSMKVSLGSGKDGKDLVGGVSLETATGKSFSTKHLGHAFKLQGTAEGKNILVLGLDPTCSRESITLRAALLAFDLEHIANSGWAQVLANLSLKLDDKQGSRNALWFDPENNYRTTVRLQYINENTSGLDTLAAWLSQGLGTLSIGELSVSLSKSSSAMMNGNNSSVIHESYCTVSFDCTLTLEGSLEKIPLRATISSTNQALKFVLSNDDVDLLQKVIPALATKVKGIDIENLLTSKVAKSILDEIPKLRRVSLTFRLNEKLQPEGVSDVSADLELLVRPMSENKSLLFLFTYSWIQNRGGRLRGSLWLKPPVERSRKHQSLLPNWEASSCLEPLYSQHYDEFVDLKTFFPTLEEGRKLPPGVPSRVNEAVIEIGLGSIMISGTMISEPPDMNNEKPRAYLGKVRLQGSWIKGGGNFRLLTDVSILFCGESKTEPPARLVGSVDFVVPASQDPLYKDPDPAGKRWLLVGVLQNFDFGHIYTLLAKRTRVALSALLRFVHADYLVLSYQYNGAVHQFQLRGTIKLGDALFEIIYKNLKDVDGWWLHISIPENSKGSNATLGKVVEGLMGAHAGQMPPFVGRIQYNSFAIDIQEVHRENKDGTTTPAGVCAVISAHLGQFEISCIMYRDPTGGVMAHEKVVLKASFPQQPSTYLPMVGQVSQPVDDIAFLLVLDRPPRSQRDDDAQRQGLTFSEVQLLNAVLSKLSLQPLVYKKNPGQVLKELDVAITHGLHFMLSSLNSKKESEVILDSVFGWKTSEKKPEKPDDKKPDGKRLEDKKPDDKKPDDKTPGTKNAAAKKQVVPYKKVRKPLEYSNLGVDYKDNTFSIYLDAICRIGPFEASLVGLYLTITFGRDKSLQNLQLQDFVIGYDMIVFGMKTSSLTLGGTFHTAETLTSTIYSTKPGARPISGPKVPVKRYVPPSSEQKPPTSLETEGIFLQAQDGDTLIEEYTITVSGGMVMLWDTVPVPIVIQAAGFIRETVPSEWVITVPKAPDQKPGEPPSPPLPATKTFIKRRVGENVFFIFFKVEGRLIQLGSVTITGITGAFGYNLQLRWPRIEEVTKFPFVAPQDPDMSPSEQLIALTAPGNQGLRWVEPKTGETWLAAGIKAEFAEVCSIDAVCIVQWAPDLRILICGVGRCELPSIHVKKKFARVEIGFRIEVNPAAGVFKLEGMLSSGSYILDESCHLRGGLAFCTWYTPSHKTDLIEDRSGDWVFSIGGYHRSFRPPAHYPRPDRLAIEWKVDEHVSVRGEAYFAMTPKACMAGGMLSVNLEKGKLRAWLTIFLDVLINRDPFSFQMDAGVTIGVNYTLEFLVTLNITVQIGAVLHIEGPPVHGTVYVDFYVFGFSVHFGSTERPEEAEISLQSFYNLIMKENTKQKEAPEVTPHTYNAQCGLISDSSGDLPKSDGPWRVRSGTFVFSITSAFPISSLQLDDKKLGVSGNNSIHARPLKASGELESQLVMNVTKAPHKKLGQNQKDEKVAWQCSTTATALPRALWDKYDATLDPTSNECDPGKLLDPDQVSTPLTTAVVFRPPPPTMSDDQLAPVNAGEVQKELVYKPGTSPGFPPPEKANTDFSPEKPDYSAKQWDKVAEEWNKPRSQLKDTVEFWSKTKAWKPKTPLCADPPAKYIEKRDDLWMRAPAFSMAVASN
ncbi:hypothetical protein PEBR_27424 [Penicillium brasilianum]|uniref:DUF6603 domain-containing protein n=1 Tax=Penicillium brasilianum TaxID=104259 RepID=A0A1S9RUZ9_PENBI|nr:hypothetical protein PEBR_27424 [Penicillium brasilianum]